MSHTGGHHTSINTGMVPQVDVVSCPNTGCIAGHHSNNRKTVPGPTVERYSFGMYSSKTVFEMRVKFQLRGFSYGVQ